MLCFTVCFAIAAVPNLVPEHQFAWECLLLFSGSRLWRVSNKLSSKGWGALCNVSSVIYNGVMNCFPSYHFAWINICNEIGGFAFFWNGCLLTPPNSSPRAESLILQWLKHTFKVKLRSSLYISKPSTVEWWWAALTVHGTAYLMYVHIMGRLSSSTTLYLLQTIQVEVTGKDEKWISTSMRWYT